jgi:hypothetical protein
MESEGKSQNTFYLTYIFDEPHTCLSLVRRPTRSDTVLATTSLGSVISVVKAHFNIDFAPSSLTLSLAKSTRDWDKCSPNINRSSGTVSTAFFSSCTHKTTAQITSRVDKIFRHPLIFAILQPLNLGLLKQTIFF